MAVQNEIFLLDSTDYVNISVWNDNRFRIIWQMIQIIKLLNLVRFVFYIEQITMVLFDRKNWDLFDLFLKIRWTCD